MRSPLWILTSSLLIFFLLVLVVILLSRQELPSRTSLRVSPTTSVPIKDVSKVNIARIYENDLFNTYIRPEPVSPVEQVTIEVPQPPAPVAPRALERPAPTFFDPLDITLKGVIYAYDDKGNRAVIMDNKSKNEQLYKIGDHIEDADIIHIGKNKVVFLRSNGQQETVFITAQAAKNDPIFAQETPWSLVVSKDSDTQYYVDPYAFVTRITTPAQFLDMLDLTTAFDKGRSIGLRVGKMDQRSIGPVLGLQFGDVVTKIQDIPTTTTKQRVQIYDVMKAAQIGSVIKVTLVRNDIELECTYTLKKIEKDLEPVPQYGTQLKDSQMIVEKAQNENISKERMEVAQRAVPSSSLKIAKRHDRQAMLHNGGRNALMQRMPADKKV